MTADPHGLRLLVEAFADELAGAAPELRRAVQVCVADAVRWVDELGEPTGLAGPFARATVARGGTALRLAGGRPHVHRVVDDLTRPLAELLDGGTGPDRAWLALVVEVAVVVLVEDERRRAA